jgi:hypothetical protein
MKLLISVLLIVHGLIVAGQSAGSFGATIPSEVPNPSFVSWFPINMGCSWLFSALGLNNSFPAYRISGILWLFGGLMLVAAGLGMFGILVPVVWWRGLALVGAATSLFMLLVYFHPLMIIGTVSSVAVLIAFGWLRWTAASFLP